MSYCFEIKIWKGSKRDDDDEKEMIYEDMGWGSRTVKSCLQAAHRTILDRLKEQKQGGQM